MFKSMNLKIGDIITYNHLRWEVIDAVGGGLFEFRDMNDRRTFVATDQFHDGWKLDETYRVERLLKYYED